jgi:hypothetical protein
MGLFGLAYGLAKTIEGVVTGDEELLIKGIKKTAINTVTTAVQYFSGNTSEGTTSDDDPDD